MLPEAPWSEGYGQAITDIAAHEFLHIVTPLNIHSEIIEHFDFETPVPSRHLWLYEGVTEWGSHMVQLRAGLKPLDAYLTELVQKIAADQTQFDPTYPLEKLALTSYGEEGQAQYGNIIAAGRWWRDSWISGCSSCRAARRTCRTCCSISWSDGKEEPFDGATFHQTLVEMTFPEIRDFIQRYVVAAEPSFTVRENPTVEQARLRAAWVARPEIRPTA